MLSFGHWLLCQSCLYLEVMWLKHPILESETTHRLCKKYTGDFRVVLLNVRVYTDHLVLWKTQTPGQYVETMGMFWTRLGQTQILQPTTWAQEFTEQLLGLLRWLRTRTSGWIPAPM